MTGINRKGTAVAATFALALFFTLAPPPEDTSTPWWDGVVRFFDAEPGDRQPAAVEAAPVTSPDVAAPKSRCHIIINGVTQEYECD